MCGIAGAIDLTGTRTFPPGRLLAMTAAIAHRGPDDEQIHIEPGVALGARRLSIIDLAGGRQPIGNEDHSVWVAFNGELFEYPELRRSCWSAATGWPRAATPRRGCTSTKTWARACSPRPGASSPSRSGTATRRTLILGRDRVGICPLYYTEVDGWLLWGSEVKALLASGMVAAKADVRGIDHLFTFFCAGTTRTFFEGINSLPPGHYLKIRDGRVTKHHVLGPRLSRRRRGATARRPDAAGRGAGVAAAAGRRAAGSAATFRSSPTSAAGSIPRSSWAFAAGIGASRFRRSRSASRGPGPMSGFTRPRPPRSWALH